MEAGVTPLFKHRASADSARIRKKKKKKKKKRHCSSFSLFMAPVSKITALSLRKPLLSQIWARHHPLPLALPIFRSVHASVYDKNFDEKIRTSFVPDEAVKPLSDKYWAPHPQTGVFGPQSEHVATLGARYTTVEAGGGGKSSVMEQKAWFRHTGLEDMEKHHPHLP